VGVLFCVVLFVSTYQRVSVWKDTTTLFNDAIEKNGPFMLGYEKMANESFDQAKYTEASNYFGRLLTLDSLHVAGRVGRAGSRFLLGDLQGAISDYSVVLSHTPKFSKVYFNRGRARVQIGDTVDALKDYSMAIENDSAFFDPYVNRSILRKRQKNYVGALEDLNKALDLNPASALAHYQRGTVYARQGDYIAACRDWEIAAQHGMSEAIDSLSYYRKNAKYDEKRMEFR
jgi:tetratricopeptide (TPR) repeat protein